MFHQKIQWTANSFVIWFIFWLKVFFNLFQFTVINAQCGLRFMLVSCHATKFGGNDRAVTPSFPYPLNKVNDPSLPHFHYVLLMFHYCPCLISVLMSLQNYSSLFVVRSLPFTLVVIPIRTIVSLSMEREHRPTVRRYTNMLP